MMISEEALYAAAPEAAEKFLSALPDREDCVHDFSPDFRGPDGDAAPPSAETAALAGPAGGGRRAGRPGGGTLRGGGDRTDCQIYWSQTDGELRYVIRLEHATTRPFQDAQLRCVPEGFILVRSSTSEIRGERSLAYRRGRMPPFTLMQTQGEDLVGSKGTACQGSEVEVNGRLGLLVEEETDSTEKDLLWTDGPYIFALHGKGLSAEELLEIARNVTW